MTKTKKILGLSEKEAAGRLRQYGFNELEKKRQWTVLRVFLRQFSNVIVWILLAASVISYLAGEQLNFWVVNFIIAFVIVMGFLQEFKAERVMEALKGIIKPMTNVIRGGDLMQVEAREVVPGDVVSLEMGDQVPADSRIIEVNNLELDESQLTGESVSVHKALKDPIYAGTQVVYGRCLAQVIQTGMKTKLGGIASMVQETEEVTPLQAKLDHLGKLLAIIALIVTGLILLIGSIKGVMFTEILIVALALAVAAVPEGLPLTMTLALSFGMRRMAKQNAVVRRMMAVETLGSTTVICTDKTGTLTQNEMTVEKLFIDQSVIEVTGKGYDPTGDFRQKGKVIQSIKAWHTFFEALMLCNNANLRRAEGRFQPVGDPTEVALITLGEKAGLQKELLDERHERLEEIFFTSERKMMSTIHQSEAGYRVFSKGAPEEILKHCQHQWVDGKKKRLTAADKKTILAQNAQFAEQALRVLAVAMKSSKQKKPIESTPEEDLVFMGLVAMKDPARTEVKQAIQTAQLAGLRVMMITGDNPQTALSIAQQIGLAEEGATVMTGDDIDQLSDAEFKKQLKTVSVLARTQPEHKLRAVQLLKSMNEVVAMTGDGVNDAPALKKADIGIAMGIKGTDVTKQAADMILQDDNFATIVMAIEEGRRIYQNVEKFTGYLISRNFTEVILILLGIFFFDFELLPLLAIQILFINAFDEEMPAIGLGLDQAHSNVMSQPPRSTRESLLNRWNALIVFSLAVFMALISFVIYIMSDPLVDIDKARTMVFATIVTMVVVDTYNFRSLRESIRVTGILNNRFLLISVGVIMAITILIMYYEPTRLVFSLVPLGLTDWLICIGASLVSLIYMEVLKFFRRKLEPSH